MFTVPHAAIEAAAWLGAVEAAWLAAWDGAVLAAVLGATDAAADGAVDAAEPVQAETRIAMTAAPAASRRTLMAAFKLSFPSFGSAVVLLRPVDA
jgi:hypothetical protein